MALAPRGMQQLTLRTDGATSHSLVHTVLSSCLNSDSVSSLDWTEL